MRCTRCDRLAIPQAVGVTDDDVVVFGWCLACLEEAGCRQIEAAARARRRSTRLVLTAARRPRKPRAQDGLPKSHAQVVPDRGHAAEARRRMVAVIVAALSIWGLLLMGAGLFLFGRQARGPVSPTGNGTPALLFGGGGATVLIGHLIWTLHTSAPTIRQVILRGFETTCLVLALCLSVRLFLDRPAQARSWIGEIIAVSLVLACMARLYERRRRPTATSSL